jgi:hypothetical protein
VNNGDLVMTAKIETIFVHTRDDGIEGVLGVDDKNKLYWNRQPIITEQKLILQWWVSVSFIITGLSTCTLALIELIRMFMGQCP